jgi:hypothetical protein
MPVNILKNACHHNADELIININAMDQREKEKGKQRKAGKQQINALYSL